MASSKLRRLERAITTCEACPRLRQHCLSIAQLKKRAYADQTYWGRPVPGFGDPRARLLVMGLAPGAHGANRTGRVFTGDRSGEWLYRALHKAGFANQPESVGADDGLELRDAWVACVVRCAPPDNQPTPDEIRRCRAHLERELAELDQVRVVIALGGVALTALWDHLGDGQPRPKFAHGGRQDLPDGRVLLMSYHPSQQNTFTGRLTEPMFDQVFASARRLLG